MRERKPIAIAAAGILAVLIGVYALGYAQGQARVSALVGQAEMDAKKAEGEAHALRQAILAQDAEGIKRDASLAQSRAEVDRKTSELAKLRASIRNPQTPNPDPAGQPILAGPEYLDSDNFIGISIKQDELINSQSDLIKQQDVKISTLLIAQKMRDDLISAQDRQIAGLTIALEAQKSLTKGALLRGRIQGLAIGLGGGYLAGRR